MARNLNRMVDTMTYDGLISGLTPEAKVKGVTIRKLGTAFRAIGQRRKNRSFGKRGIAEYRREHFVELLEELALRREEQSPDVLACGKRRIDFLKIPWNASRHGEDVQHLTRRDVVCGPPPECRTDRDRQLGQDVIS